jgi:phage terminase large subunit-like protein
LLLKGVMPVIPPKANRRTPAACDFRQYRDRNRIERMWCDELAAWKYLRETWDMAMFGLRLGDRPRTCITTTPKPNQVLREIIKDRRTIVTCGSTFDNAGNLAPTFLQAVRDKYEGTRLGRQELNAELLDDVPGALWTRDMIDAARKDVRLPEMQRIVVSIDPSGTAGDQDDGDSIGIIVAGKGVDGHGYILADRTCKLSPDGWGRRAVAAYHEFKADRIIAERNYGGAMVEHVIKTVDRTVPYQEVVAKVTINTRNGADAETAYPGVVSAMPSIWTTTWRGCKSSSSSAPMRRSFGSPLPMRARGKSGFVGSFASTCRRSSSRA